MSKKQICAIIGHKSKDLITLSPQHKSKLKALISQEIQKILEDKVYTYLCGMDDGTDLMSCEILLGFKKMYSDIFLECVVPYTDQPKFWLAEDRETYFRILEKCDYENVINPKYTKTHI